MQAAALIGVDLKLQNFGMGLQEALHAPRVRTASVQFSSTPHEAYPELLRLEADLI